MSLQTLNQFVLLVEPATSREISSERRDPSLIILFGWMAARTAHLLKYVDILRERFPTSTLVIIKSTYSSTFFMSQKKLEPVLEPALQILRREMNSPTAFGGVLLHVFSNGGGFQLQAFRKLLLKTVSQQAPVPPVPTALVLDSVPGDYAVKSLTAVLAPRRLLLRLLSLPFLWMLYALLRLIGLITGRGVMFHSLREDLNTHNILPLTNSSNGAVAVPRMYIYSKTDELVAWKDVARHAKNARQKGIEVQELVLEKSPHVAHARTDPVGYWAAVADIWSTAQQTRRS